MDPKQEDSASSSKPVIASGSATEGNITDVSMDAPSKYLDLTSIKKAKDFKTKDVYVADWGGWITLKSLTGKQRDAFETSLRVRRQGKADVSTENMRAKLVALCAIVSPTDQTLLFGQNDLGWLGDKGSAPLSLLYDEASDLSGFTKDDKDELEGNSKAGHTGNSKSE